MWPKLNMFKHKLTDGKTIMEYFVHSRKKYKAKLQEPVTEDKTIHFSHLLYESYRMKETIENKDIPNLKHELMLLK